MLNFKRLLAILLVLSMLVAALTACNVGDTNENVTTIPFETEGSTDDIDDVTTTEDGTTTEDDTTTREEETTTKEDETTTSGGSNIYVPQPNSEISIKEAVEYGLTFSSNKFSADKYFVRGEVVSIITGTNPTITIKDSEGRVLMLYRAYGNNGTAYDSLTTKPAVGDTILVYGVIGQYKGDAEMMDVWVVEVIVKTPTGGGNGNQGGGNTDVGGLPEDTSGATQTNDPYENVSKSQFYANYKPAMSYWDAYWRTQHNFMSGSLTISSTGAPETASYQPKLNGLFVRNDSALYGDDGNTYYVLDAYGNIAFAIYRGGAYISLEEVAAYIFAFGEIPANYSENKKTKPTASPWGEYLRNNHSSYSNDVIKYPDEPELPNMFKYYEMDIGTTSYNNGTSISRGACRIVYARFDKNGNKVIEPEERYVFYTYNHYYDFQEYLNYEGGWGEIFGYYTSGNGTPSPYVQTARAYFATVTASTVVIEEIELYFVDTKYLYYMTAQCA